MRFASIVGARPDFVQVGVLSKALRRNHDEVTIHTGQHYDEAMSDVFFAELALPKPEINLGIGSSDPSAQTGRMLAAIGACLRDVAPDAVLVRGDTNGTIAAAIAARQGFYPLVHIEAGCRSYDRAMPEEINRITSDHLADVCLATDATAARNLAAEGIRDHVVVTGDVMYDTYVVARRKLEGRRPPAALPSRDYVVLTSHRGENVDDPSRLSAILSGFAEAAVPVIFPMHPRTRKRIEQFGLTIPKCITVLPPLGYLDMIAFERGARTIFTDSGGVQREAYYAGVPCVTLRDTTEWTNTVEAGWNRLVGADPELIRRNLACPPPAPLEHPSLFGDGHAAERIIEVLESVTFAKIVIQWRKRRGRLRQ